MSLEKFLSLRHTLLLQSKGLWFTSSMCNNKHAALRWLASLGVGLFGLCWFEFPNGRLEGSMRRRLPCLCFFFWFSLSLFFFFLSLLVGIRPLVKLLPVWFLPTLESSALLSSTFNMELGSWQKYFNMNFVLYENLYYINITITYVVYLINIHFCHFPHFCFELSKVKIWLLKHFILNDCLWFWDLKEKFNIFKI